MMKIIILCLALIVASSRHVEATTEIIFKTETIKTFELFTMMVKSDLFNWTGSVVEQFR